MGGGSALGGVPWAGDSNDSGELAGSARLSYWLLHGEGDESYLQRLGLGPASEAAAKGRPKPTRKSHPRPAGKGRPKAR